VLDWKAKQQTRAAVQHTIRFALDELPQEPYPEGVWNTKVDAVWSYVLVEGSRYPGSSTFIENLLHRSEAMPITPAVRLFASWGSGGDVAVHLAGSKRNWSKIIRGHKVSIRRKGYFYDEEFFWTTGISPVVSMGKLVISYASKDGDIGDGFIGTPRVGCLVALCSS
jgi:hypothetical protein